MKQIRIFQGKGVGAVQNQANAFLKAVPDDIGISISMSECDDYTSILVVLEGEEGALNEIHS